MNYRISSIKSLSFSALAPAVATAMFLIACEARLGTTGDASRSNESSGDSTNAGSLGSGDPINIGDTAGPVDTSTPLARLTNGELINSARALLRLPQDTQIPEQTEKLLAPEPIVRGLTSDSHSQHLTRVTLAGYTSFANALTDIFLAGVETEEQLAERLSCEAQADDLDQCVRSFIRGLLPRAYRRDVTKKELSDVDALLDEVNEILADLSEDPGALPSQLLRVKTGILQILLSPDFLLMVERGEPQDQTDPLAPRRLTGFEIATRLSYFATASSPDDELLDVARQGKLTDPEVRLEQADRLLGSRTGEEHFTNILTDWLAINPEETSQDDVDELKQFIAAWFAQEKPFRDFYGGMVTVDHVDETTSEQPFGVLGTAAFINSHSSPPTPGFITRGVFVVESLLCGLLPDDVPAAAIDGADATELEIFENHAKQPCATCHVAFDAYGAAFQHFSTETGLYDPRDNQLGTDFSLYEFEGISGTATDLADLGEVFGESQRAPSCMAELWYRHALRRGFNAQEGDAESLQRLVGAWKDTDNTSMKSLLRVIIGSEDFITLVQ